MVDRSTTNMAPVAPIRLEDMGLPTTLMQNLLLKAVFRMGLQTPSEMAEVCAVSPPIVDSLIALSREENLFETLGNRGASASEEMRYQLTAAGRSRALDALAQSEYYGCFPVPLAVFEEQSKKQSIKNAVITKQALEEATSHLVLPDGMLDELGPAVNSGRAMLLYGPPGNGKSAISDGICDALGDAIYVPVVVEAFGQIIGVFDPIVHQRVTEADESEGSELRLRRETPHDPRFYKCKRPTVMTGGELTLDMLDLNFNPISRTYQAPLQMKSTGGVFIVDDLGRQRESPQALMNRWIVPIEQRYDLLALQSGQKFTVPFDTLVIFSTNFAPKKLFDGAALRRIYYKIKVDGPNQRDFIEIFARVARKYKVKPSEEVLAHMLTKLYPTPQGPFASFHAPFLIDQMMSIVEYEQRPREMTVDLVERAWANLFVADEENTL
ncbi:MAG: ATPase [Pseudomonadota bacterium]